MVSFTLFLTTAAFATSVLGLVHPGRSTPTTAPQVPCVGYQVVNSTTNHLTGVTTAVGTCAPNNAPIKPRGIFAAADDNNLSKRDCAGWDFCDAYNACNDPRTNYCYPGTGGPDPNHCDIITNSTLTNAGYSFNLEPNQVITFSYSTCTLSVTSQINWTNNGRPVALNFCYSEVASYGHWLAWNCQAAQGSNGGIAVATTNPPPVAGHNQPWYLMVTRTKT